MLPGCLLNMGIDTNGKICAIPTGLPGLMGVVLVPQAEARG